MKTFQWLLILIISKFGDFATEYRFTHVSIHNFHPEIALSWFNITEDGKYLQGFMNVIKPMDKIFVIFIFKNMKFLIEHHYFQFHIQLYVLRNNTLQPLGKKLTVDWCKLMNGGNSNDYMTRFIFRLYKETTPQFIHKCPYSGMMVIEKFPVPRAYVIMVPEGTQRKVFNITNGKLVIGTYEEEILFF